MEVLDIVLGLDPEIRRGWRCYSRRVIWPGRVGVEDQPRQVLSGRITHVEADIVPALAHSHGIGAEIIAGEVFELQGQRTILLGVDTHGDRVVGAVFDQVRLPVLVDHEHAAVPFVVVSGRFNDRERAPLGAVKVDHQLLPGIDAVPASDISLPSGIKAVYRPGSRCLRNRTLQARDGREREVDVVDVVARGRGLLLDARVRVGPEIGLTPVRPRWDAADVEADIVPACGHSLSQDVAVVRVGPRQHQAQGAVLVSEHAHGYRRASVTDKVRAEVLGGQVQARPPLGARALLDHKHGPVGRAVLLSLDLQVTGHVLTKHGVRVGVLVSETGSEALKVKHRACSRGGREQRRLAAHPVVRLAVVVEPRGVRGHEKPDVPVGVLAVARTVVLGAAGTCAVRCLGQRQRVA